MKKQMVTLLLLVGLLMSVMVPPAGAADGNVLIGDVEQDGEIDSIDALAILKANVGSQELSDEQKIAADVDADGDINSVDALQILQYSVGYFEYFEADKPAEFEKLYVEPVGLEKGNIYLVEAAMFTDFTGRNYDRTRLAVCIQGLVNRNFDQHGVAVALNLDSTDAYWLEYISQEGRTYEGMEVVNVKTFAEFLNTFGPFLKEYGIIAWDPAVPSTANVASTICGLENCIPVQYSQDTESLYHMLTTDLEIPVKQSLVGMFDGKKGTKITGTNIDSTGSSKNDAYLWAMEKYMDRCNTELLAYTLDGASSVQDNPVYDGPDAYNAQITGIPNQDYFIAKQCFFFDLTSYGGEAPNDDPNQPLGTDAATLKKILQRRFDLAKGTFGMVLGFPPWHVKYTTHGGNGVLEAPRLEWHFVEVCTSFNCGIEADAANPCWMSNGSLYTNYERVVETTANAPAKNVKFDPMTRYFTFVWAGDYDCSPWLKARAALTWTDRNIGNGIPFMFSVNVNLVDRIPMAFDLMYENRTENEYILAAEGMGYVVPSALVKGFKGAEADPITRTLSTAKRQFLQYGKPYYDMLKLDVTSRVINGFTEMEQDAMEIYNELSPKGSFVQSSTAGPEHDIKLYKGVPYMRTLGVGGNTTADKAGSMYNVQVRTMNRQGLNFSAFEMTTMANYCTPTGIMDYIKAYTEYCNGKAEFSDYKTQYVDVNTYLDLLKQSGQGVVLEELK